MARPSCPCAAKVSAACRSPSAITSPTMRCATGSSTTRAVSSRTRMRVTSPVRYDVNVIGDYNIGGDAWASRILLEEIGPPRGRQLVGRRDARGNRARAQGQAQSHPLLPVDELHLPPHGREIWRRLAGVQFLRSLADRSDSMRKIAKHFGPEIEAKAEEVIAKYRPLVEADHREIWPAPRRASA